MLHFANFSQKAAKFVVKLSQHCLKSEIKCKFQSSYILLYMPDPEKKPNSVQVLYSIERGS